MRRVTKPGARRRRSSQEIVVRHDAGTRSPKRTAATPDLTVLGEGCGETLPSLRRIPTSYRLETNGERLYRPCLALVERNLADAKLWQKSGNVAVVFARSAIQQLIEEFSGGALTDKIDYCFEVRDDLGTGYWRGGALGEGKLMAAFELQACGYLKIGAALDALEGQERFLGTAFYYLLRGSLWTRRRRFLRRLEKRMGSRRRSTKQPDLIASPFRAACLGAWLASDCRIDYFSKDQLYDNLWTDERPT